jgi:hypothetical protein
MIELTEQQRQALDERPGEPLQLFDPRTNRAYVLLTAEQYERIRGMIDPGPLTPDERRVILRGVWRRAGWDDPRMDVYNHLDEPKDS